MVGERIGKREHKRKVCIEMSSSPHSSETPPSFPHIQTLPSAYLSIHILVFGFFIRVFQDLEVLSYIGNGKFIGFCVSLFDHLVDACTNYTYIDSNSCSNQKSWLVNEFLMDLTCVCRRLPDFRRRRHHHPLTSEPGN